MAGAPVDRQIQKQPGHDCQVLSVSKDRRPHIMATRNPVVFYSMYGHIYRMAEAVAAGAREVPGSDVTLFQFAELVRPMGRDERRRRHARGLRADSDPTPEQLANADAIIFGTPTRFGICARSMRNLLDQTGGCD